MRRDVREYVLYPDILAMLVIALSSLGVALTRSGSPRTWLSLVAGSLLFFVTEYTTHRFFFHMDAPTNPFLRWTIERLHYHHHERPDDLDLLFLPIWYSLPQLVIFGAAAWWVMGGASFGAAFAAGSALSLLYYEWTHFVAHRPITPLTPWGRWMKKYHLWHHFKNEHYWFGVTNPSLDLVLGTYRDQSQVAKSPTARKLGGDG